MVSLETFRQIALSFSEAEEMPHFQLPSFRIKKKIFAALWEKENRAMIKLPVANQSVFCPLTTALFFSVPGGWGKKVPLLLTSKK
jgi:hypothetical protein